jgi:hypothetical protein
MSTEEVLKVSDGLMSEHAFFEYRAKPMSTPDIKEQGEPIHCLIKMEIGAAGLRRPRELLKQQARDLIFFSVSPRPHRRISHSNICEVGEKRLRELGPATDFNRRRERSDLLLFLHANGRE